MLFYLYKDVCYLYTFKYKQMKKLACFSVLVLLLFVVSCQSDKKSDSYYDQMNKKATAEELLQRINLPIDKVAKKEKKKNLIEQDDDLLVYKYELSELDFYELTYVFDELGCFEVGLDFQVNNKEQLGILKEAYTKQFNESKDFRLENDINGLARWLKNDESITVELDYALQEDGILALTIFANE